MDHTLSMKTTKFMSIENLYKYSNRLLELDCSTCINAVLLLTTVLVQIFKGRIFRGCHKFSIFAILFSRITGIGKEHRLCVHYYKIFEDLIFVDYALSAKTAKFTSLKNLYEYGISLMILVLCMCIMVNFIIFVIFTIYIRIINVIIITSVIIKPGAPACGWCTPVL